MSAIILGKFSVFYLLKFLLSYVILCLSLFLLQKPNYMKIRWLGTTSQLLGASLCLSLFMFQFG